MPHYHTIHYNMNVSQVAQVSIKMFSDCQVLLKVLYYAKSVISNLLHYCLNSFMLLCCQLDNKITVLLKLHHQLCLCMKFNIMNIAILCNLCKDTVRFYQFRLLSYLWKSDNLWMRKAQKNEKHHINKIFHYTKFLLATPHFNVIIS